jgi:hypothetical protein
MRHGAAEGRLLAPEKKEDLIDFPDNRFNSPIIKSSLDDALASAKNYNTGGTTDRAAAYDFSNDPVNFAFSNENYTRRDDDVMNQLNRITAGDSPLMKQAQTEGLQQANRRGLLNSSMAVGAAQDSAYRAALPVASQNAQQAAAENMLMREIGSRENLAVADIAAVKERLGIELTSREKTAFAEMAEAKARLGMQLTASERQALIQSSTQRDIAQAQIDSATQIANAQLSNANQIAKMNVDATASNLRAELESRLQNTTISADATLANNTLTYLTNIRSITETALANINNNKDIPADERQQMIAAVFEREDNAMNLLQQSINADFDWVTASGTTTGETRQAEYDQAWNHYQKYGQDGGRTWTDAASYLNQYPDVKNAIKSGATF